MVKICHTCKHMNRQRVLCIECNGAYEKRESANWPRVGWEPSQEYLEVIEEFQIENKAW